MVIHIKDISLLLFFLDWSVEYGKMMSGDSITRTVKFKEQHNSKSELYLFDHSKVIGCYGLSY